MLLLNVFTLDKNNERLSEELSPPSEDLFILTKLQVALVVCLPGSGLVVGPRCWPLGSQPQHIVPDRGKDVTSKLLSPPGASSE